MSQPPAVAALRISFQTLATKAPGLGTADFELLRRHVCAAVDELRQREVPVERTVAIVRELGINAGFSYHSDGTLLRVMVWCIEQYYTTPNQPLPILGA